MRNIEIEVGDSSIFGYVCSPREENISNYLWEYTNQTDLIMQHLRFKGGRVALLRNIWVDEGSRGQGIGNHLTEQFFEEAHDADTFILVCDTMEEQAEGFELKAWYESFGFRTVLETGCGPLMVMPEEKAQDLIEALKGF